MRLRELWHIVNTTRREWSRDHALRLSAALAYYTTLSLAPLLLIVIAISALVFGNDRARDAILMQITALIGETGGQAAAKMLENSNRPGTGILAGVTGVVMLLIAATGVVGELQGALNAIWNVERKSGGIKRILRTRIVSFAMILGIGFLLLVSLVISAAISALGTYWGSDIALLVKSLHLVLSTAIITTLFAAMFRYLPDVKLKWRNIWLGAFVTAVLFTIGKSLTGLYLAKSSLASSYGAAGSVVIILLWVYYSSAIFLFGAEFTQVYTNYKEGGAEAKPGVRTKERAA
jgi:membrane protein